MEKKIWLVESAYYSHSSLHKEAFTTAEKAIEFSKRELKRRSFNHKDLIMVRESKGWSNMDYYVGQPNNPLSYRVFSVKISLGEA